MSDIKINLYTQLRNIQYLQKKKILILFLKSFKTSPLIRRIHKCDWKWEILNYIYIQTSIGGIFYFKLRVNCLEARRWRDVNFNVLIFFNAFFIQYRRTTTLQ